MKALVYEGPRVMTLRDLEPPRPGPGEVLVRVAYSGICGSELSGYLGRNSLRTPPLVFGHELSGVVEQPAPDVHTLEVGARVTVNPLMSCGLCRYCVTGSHQLCGERLLLGASLPGANGELISVRASAVEGLPDGLDLRDAAMTEPAACAVHAVETSGVRPEDQVLVVGAGPIGLFLVQVLEAYGVTRIIATDPHPVRAQMAADLGAVVLPSDDDSLLAGIRDLTERSGVRIAFDAAGTQRARRNSLAAVSRGGRVMLVGLHEDETAVPLNTVIRDEIAVHGIFAYPPAAFRTALSWLSEGRLGLASGVVEAGLAEGPSWYERLVDGAPVAKVLLRPAAPPQATGDVPCA